MRYCKKCLQPDTRPGLYFNEKQICYACLYEEEKKNIDWANRWQELQKIAEQAQKKSSAYDCVIGVSGGKDSTFQAVTAKEKLGLNPLLVNCVPDNMTPAGQHNIDNLAKLGFDIIKIQPDPNIARKLARHAFLSFGNIFIYSERALWVSSCRIAEKFEIPLIIQGENTALVLGTCLHTDTSANAFNALSYNTIQNSSLDELPEKEFPKHKLYMYRFPDIKEMQEKSITAIWLQYYMKNWSHVGNADFAVARGLTGRMTEDLHDIGRYRRFASLDDDCEIANQMIKYLKFGFGFATDEACYDIREGRLSREDAIWYVKEYDGRCGQQYIDAYCESIDISEKKFWETVDNYVNKKLFFKDSKNKWKPKFTVGVDFIE